MRAVTISQPGGPDVLTLADVPSPVSGPGEVLVKVTATAVNRADLLQRQGKYPPPPGASPYPGLECSGVVVELGPPSAEPAGATGGAAGATDGWPVGAEVCALLPGGGYAEYVTVPAAHLLPVPAGIDLVDAAALPEVACTVWSNLVSVAGLRTGQTLLVHGGGSGIGTFAIQFARALGATVLTTARSEKHAALRRLGATVTIDYSTDDFTSAVLDATADRGVDVILDIVGGKYLMPNLEALAEDGKLVIIGTQGGYRAELNIATLLRKRASIAATVLRGRPLDQKAAIVAGVRRDIWPMIASGLIRPVIDRRLPITAAPAAHQVVAESRHLGKVLLVWPEVELTG